ncbi:MAG TPA: CorA family divalent cation transporter, partial [Actinomycetota bacterium]|nr:CorA family divalent cation transporter [Actinomycetota bacterium]
MPNCWWSDHTMSSSLRLLLVPGRTSCFFPSRLVPTMIAGIYGMNFRWMPELEHPFGYPAIMGLMLGACGFLYLQFKRSG